LQEVKGIIGSHLGKESLLEIGCGKAYFFEMLRNAGFDVRGCDPTYEGASPYIAKAFYSRSLGFRGDGVILRHVLEHIPDPTEFLIGLSQENAGGRIYIEVPCLEWIRENNAWFDVFYEHVNYFRLSDLVGMFDRVRDSGHLFGGQYIYIVADLASIKKPKATEGDVFSFSGQFKPAFPTEGSHRRIVIWGAASKGVIYALHAKRAGIEIDYAIDVNPAKHGRYLPVTGIEVISPEKAVELLPHETTVVIMNPNYQAEIRELSKDGFFYSSANHE
jgi:hypothetical protein